MSWMLRKKLLTFPIVYLAPPMKYLLLLSVVICLVTVISSWLSKPIGDCYLFLLSNRIDTSALITPACPPL